MIAADLVEIHAAAVLDRVRAKAELADVVFEGDVFGNPDMYVNVFHDTGFYSAHEYTDTIAEVEVTFTIHSVGRDRWQAAKASGWVLAQLTDYLPRIPGRTCWRIKPAGSSPIRKDTDVLPPRWIAVDRFTLRSTPS